MNNLNINKYLTITITAIIALTAIFSILNLSPIGFDAQLLKLSEDQNIAEVASLANSVDQLFKTYSELYRTELLRFENQKGRRENQSSLGYKQFRGDLVRDFRIGGGLSIPKETQFHIPSFYTCAFSHLSVDLMIECVLNARGRTVNTSNTFASQLNRANPSKYNSKLQPSRNKLNNWAFWVRNNWEPRAMK